MALNLATIALVVGDYDEAIRFFRDSLGFALIEDTPLGGGKRWVVVKPPGGDGAKLLLARADGEVQRAAIGRQAGGRVGFFLETDDFSRDFSAFSARGVRFLEAPRQEPYGTVAVFEDICGNKWDLIEPGGTMSGAASGSLTGVWQGLYTYPKSLRHVPFSATLMEAGDWVTGSTHELCDHGAHKGRMLYALLDGQRSGSRLSFAKTYEAGLEGFGVVHYEGTISADLAEIEGRWRTGPGWSGPFLMIRSGGKEQAAERKAAVHV